MTGDDRRRRPGAAEQRRLLAVGLARTGLTAEQLWRRYFALGGLEGPVEVQEHLDGGSSLPAAETDLLAQAVNERLDELSGRRVPYRLAVREPPPRSGPLAALVEALEGSHRAPPERLPAVAAAAGRALGVEVALFLVDYEQEALVPAGGGGEPLGIDSTVAGRAFSRVQVLTSASPDRPRMWFPLLDGVERLGVVEVGVDDPADLDDPHLRDQCRWLGALLGHLVTATTRYGDGLDVLRRSTRRTAAAELVWELLPPLTAGTESFVLAGLLEPAYAVGGDAFDYALSATTAHLAVFDATGHSLFSGLVAAAALSAYRAARRGGEGLYHQAAAIDETVGDLFGRTARLVTGVLAEVDLASGRLRYVIAGHPPPMLMRGGRVVRSLDGGRRPLFGIAAAASAPAAVRNEGLTVGEEVLQPGDWLVLHTDGVTEARDAAGEFFGEERLVEFLEREAAADAPPPETVRRLVRAVLRHQDGVLQDDATLVLARWSPVP